jgi:hypothetical protein
VPVIEVCAPAPSPGPERLRELSDTVTALLGIPTGMCWVLWRRVDPTECYRPEWAAGSVAPIVFLTCKEQYAAEQVEHLNATVAAFLSTALGCPANEIYVADRRVRSGELFTRGATVRWDTTARLGPSCGDLSDTQTAKTRERGERLR